MVATKSSIEASPAFITGQEIRDKHTEFFEKDYDKDYTMEDGNDCAYYRLRLGAEVYVSTEDTTQYLNEKNDVLSVKPGEFALLTTLETLKLPPNYLGFISMKFDPKSRGLINVSGFQVDPGFEGRLIFSVYNAGPSDAILRYKDAIFLIMFAKTTSHAPYRGKFHKLNKIPVGLISAVKGEPVSLPALNRKLDRLSSEMKIYWIVTTAVLSAVVGFILQKLLG